MPPEKIDFKQIQQDATDIFNCGLNAVNASAAVKKYCRVTNHTLYIGKSLFDLNAYDHLYIIGAGKASAQMAAAIEEQLLDKITDGIINVKYEHTAPLSKIKLIEAGHPIPDENGRKGAKAIIQLLENAGKNDLIICLMSGGGSALLPLPAPSITLEDKQKTIITLLSCGATINEINAIRKHISHIKGGQLAHKAFPAKLITLILSDVVGDNLDVIASGPTVPDFSTFKECSDIIAKYEIADNIPGSVSQLIRSGVIGNIPETPKTDDPIFNNTFNLIVASNSEALNAAKNKSESLGYNTMVLSSMIEGDTSEAARFHTAIAKEIKKTGNPIAIPACILSGGETTVTLTGDGLGGRNQEFALIAAMEIQEEDGIVILSGGTDGTDGPTDAAGAIADSNTVRHAVENGIDPHHFLKNNDSYHFFKQTNGLLFTGPTGTNVMDLRVMIIK